MDDLLRGYVTRGMGLAGDRREDVLGFAWVMGEW